jgi:hypothetical protein
MFQLPEGLDAGEAILAVVGVRPLLTAKVEKITGPEWEQIGKLDRTIYKLARDLARGQLDRSTFPAINYDRSLAALTSTPDQAQIQGMVDQFPVELHDATTAFLGQSARALNYLRTKFPVSRYVTVFGNVNLSPSFCAIDEFEDLLEVVDRPLSIFAMVDEGRLTSDMALAMQTVYPGLYVAIVKAIVTRVVLEKARTKDYDPSFEHGAAVLLAVPGLDPGLRQLLQTPAPDQQQNQQPAQPADSAAKSMASTAQQLSAPK